jgi:transcriptional regulator with XRE-family HTH domain
MIIKEGNGENITMSAKQATIGDKIKRRRETLGYSLRTLAKMTNLSASFLSQVELDRTNMSLSSLHSVAAALEVPLLYFLGEKTPTIDSTMMKKEGGSQFPESDGYDRIITKDARTKLIMQKSGVTYELLVPGMGRKMVAFQRSLSPGHEHPVRRVLKEPTEEFVYVISGDLMIELTTGIYVVHPEETMYFEGQELLGFKCASTDCDANWLTVITPAVF